MAHLSSSFSATVRLRLDDRPGSFARLAAAIAAEGGSLGAIDLVRVERKTKVRDVVILAADAAHLDEIVTAVEQVEGTEVLHLSDRTFLLHAAGRSRSHRRRRCVPVTTSLGRTHPASHASQRRSQAIPSWSGR